MAEAVHSARRLPPPRISHCHHHTCIAMTPAATMPALAEAPPAVALAAATAVPADAARARPDAVPEVRGATRPGP
jgi:hypothetical protein